MKITYPLFVLLLATLSVTAQVPGGGGGNNLGSPMSGSLNIPVEGNHIMTQQFFNDAFAGKYTADKKYFDIEGNAFLTEEAVKGTLIMNDGARIVDVPLQIDLYRNDIIATTTKGDDIYLDQRHFEEIIIPIDGRDRSFRKISLENPDQFYEILFIDLDLVFFKETYVTRKEALSNGINSRPARFTRRKKFYIKHRDEEIKRVKLKKKKIFEGLSPEAVKSIKEYAKENNIKFKDEYDYADVFEAVFK